MGARQFPNDWYLLAYQANPPNTARKLRKQVMFAALAVALAAAVLTCWAQYHSQVEAASEVNQIVEQPAAPTTVTPQITPDTKQGVLPVGRAAQNDRSVSANGSADDSALSLDQAERLKARNRRLEALVKVLRHRTSEAKSAPAQTPLSR